MQTILRILERVGGCQPTLYLKIENRCWVWAPQLRGLLKRFWPGILGSVKGQLAETLDSGQSFRCRPMTLSHSKYVNQQIRPPTSRPNDATLYLALGPVKGQLNPKCHPHDFPLHSLMVSSSARRYTFIVVRISE